jgi:hypothetical protein
VRANHHVSDALVQHIDARADEIMFAALDVDMEEVELPVH